MASAAEIARLRLLVAEPDATTYTDEDLSTRLDGVQGNQNQAAASIWREKAAQAAGLVDTSEGGSSRKLGDLHEQALGMSAYFSDLDASTGPTGGTRVHRLRR